MGADILPPHNPQHVDPLQQHHQSQYRISMMSHYHSQNHPHLVNYISRDFKFTQETLATISRQQIVENNFSQEFDPLFTTFRPENKNIYGKFRILCSNITNEKIQEYKMFFRNENDFRTYLVSYFWRKNNSEQKNWPLVKTTNLRVYEESKRILQGGLSNLIKSKCSASKQVYCRIYIQDIPLRLCHIKDIPFPQNLYVMTQVLKGFQIIYENIGYIKPFEDLMCITRKGQIKVWINSDLSKNFPNIQNIDDNITSSKSESKLVNQILEIVVNNTDPTGEPLSIYAYLRQQHVNLEFITFEKVLEMIQKYSILYQIQIPKVFGSIVQVLNQEQEEYDTYRTDMQHGNQEKVQSSQPIRSQNRSGSGLFLDVPNSSSRLKLNPNHTKSKLSSKKQSSRKLQQKHKNKTQKTQSLKIGQHERNSLEQSISGGKSNVMLSESLPISRSMNQQPSSNEINGSNISNKDLQRREQSNTQIQKLNEGNFVQIERESEHSNDSVMAIRESKEREEDIRNTAGVSELMDRKNMQLMGSNRLSSQHDASSGHIIYTNNKNVPIHHPLQQNQIPSKAKISQKSNIPSHKQFNELEYEHSETWAMIHSNNDLPLNNSRHPSEFLKNKKTYSNLCMDRKYSDRVLLNEEDVSPSDKDTMVIRVQATEEEMQQMIEIDKFIQAEVMKQEQQKLRLSQMYPSRNQLMNKSQQLMNSSHHFAHLSDPTLKSPSHPLNKSQQLPYPKLVHNQTDQRLNQTTIALPPVLNRYSSSHMSERQEELIPQMLTSRQKQLSNESGMYNDMHSSHHVQHLEHRLQDDHVLSSHIVQKSGWSNHQNGYGDSNVTKVAALNELIYIDDRERVVSPHSRSSMVSNNHYQQPHLSFQQINTHIEIQPPSSSSRMNNNSENTLTNPNDSQKISQNNIPNVVISTASNQVFVPISQHQLLASSGHRQQPPQTFVSSTSIGYSITGPTAKQVHYLSNVNTIISSPLQSEANRMPKVTFNTKAPEQVLYANNNSSKNVSLNNINFSQKQISKNSSHLYVSPLGLSHSGEDHNDHNPNRLSYRAQTMVSAYVHSQGENTSSRKYYDYEENSSYSKPSIVEYSYLRNPEYFGNGHHNAENQNSRILQRSMQNSLQKIPTLSVEFIQEDPTPQREQRTFSRTQINHHYTYNAGPYDSHMNDIIPIPEQTQAQMFNNSRSLVNNDEYLAGQSNSNSLAKNHFNRDSNNELSDQIVMVSSRQLRNESQHHQREPSGVKLVESQKDQTIHQVVQDTSKHRKQSYFISEEYSHGLEDPIRSQSSNRHPQFKINIRPSFQSMSGCSQRQNQPFSNKSFITYSKKQNKSSYLSGQEKQNDHELRVGQRASDQGSNQNEQQKSAYRVVESIEENRANSTYQMDIEESEKQGKMTLNIDQRSSVKVKGQNLDKRLSSSPFNNTQGKSQQGNPIYEKESPRESQKATPRGRVFHKPPVTGRTMFMNKENQLLSEFIDQQSELESQVDYTYNSYDKWKDKSKVLDFGPSRFKEFDEKIEEEGENTRKFNNVAFNYPERHGNHKQLVKSSIEGNKLLSHEFSRRDNFNTVQKSPECNEAQQVKEQNSNQLFFQSFSPEKRIDMHRYRKSSEYKEEEIDEDILNDLREY